MIDRIRRASLPLLLALVTLPARGDIDFTDTWWTPAEPGWGANLQQQHHSIYVTFYVYGNDGRPTWLAALLARDGTRERFTGTLFRTTGTYFGAPAWSGYTSAPAGTASFTGTSSTTGTLAYTVDGVAVTKTIERITLAPLTVAGLYIGGVSGRRSGCAASGSIIETKQIEILHATATGDIRIDQISTSTGALVCRMQGIAVQTGKLLTVDNATYTCTDGWNAPARIYNLRPTPGGFEAQWLSDAGGGCTESGQLSGVTQFP
ncbi:MAG: hypothetical protein IT493_08630 [Gammaproteobacteria bacterium]|nr:hypothetical protein [Gammaproteobacteria bacterium]